MKFLKQKTTLFSILILSVCLQACQTAPIRNVEALPEVALDKQRIYLARQAFGHIINKKERGLSPAEKAGIFVGALVIGGAFVNAGIIFPGAPVAHRNDALREIDVFTFDSQKVKPMTVLTAQDRAKFFDVDKDKVTDLSLGMGVYSLRLFANYIQNFGYRKNQFGEEGWVDVVAFGSRVREVNGELLKPEPLPDDSESHPQFSDEATEGKQEAIIVNGVTHIKISLADAKFCESLRVLKLTQKEVVKMIQDKSFDYLPANSYLQSSPRFDLACSTIAFAEPVTMISEKRQQRLFKSEKKIQEGFSKYGSIIDENPVIYLKKR